MSDKELFKPKSYPARRPTDTRQVNGAIINPPRMMQIGGADKLSKGFKKNSLNLVKPRGTK